MKTKFLSALFIISSLSLSAQGVWTQKANFGSTARVWATGFSIGNKGYIGTGYDNGALDSTTQNTKDFWEYDQTINVWTQKADFPGIPRSYSSGFSIGSKGYIGLGLINNTSTCFNDFYEYDPLTNTWAQKANFPGGVRFNCADFVIGNKGYIGTGTDGNLLYQDFWEWDQATNIWTPKANFPSTSRAIAVGFSIGTKGYIGTGSDNGVLDTSTAFTKDFWEWDQTTNTWTQKANFAGGARYDAVAFSIGTKGYIGTGHNGSYLKDFWEWDQVNDVWIQKANVGGNIRQGAVGFSIGNRGYIGTGGWMYNDFWEFNPQDSSFNLLTGSVFTDANTNCILDGGDSPLSNWLVEAKSSTATLYGSTSTNGSYNIWVPTGTYSVTLIPKTYWNQVCPLSSVGYNVPVSSQDTVANLDFGADVSVYCPDLAVSIGSANMRRCMLNNFYVQYWNNGTTTATNALLKINFDPKVIPLSSTVPWDSISGNSYFWKVDSVLAGEYVTFSMVDSISCNAQLGDTLYASAQWLNVAGDCDFENNIDYDHHVVIGSFDPNAKEAYTSTNEVYIKQANILPTDTINYMIQFQNTGTDTAFKVVVYDTLDADLNIPSVISGVSSHPYTFQLMGAGILKWTFNNILLPDSNINEPASHGFVKFQILQKPNNPNGTVIKNSAAIVFDFNAPVITDTVFLTIADLVSVQDTKGEDNTISIYPNPSSGVFRVQMNNGQLSIINYQLSIYNVLGEEIYRSSVCGERLLVDISNQSDGMYFLQLKTWKGVATKKLIIRR